MIVVLDVNPLLSALIRDSTSRRIISNESCEFYFPKPALQKLEKYKEFIQKKSGLSEQEYAALLGKLLQCIVLIGEEELSKQKEKARKIMGHIDEEDVIFIATALTLNSAVIWSDDKHFEKQNEVVVFKTKDMVDLFLNQN